GNAGGISELPLCRHLRPRGVHLEHRYVAGSRLGSLRCRLCSEKRCPFHASDDDQCNQNGPTKILALHGFSPIFTRHRTVPCKPALARCPGFRAAVEINHLAPELGRITRAWSRKPRSRVPPTGPPARAFAVQ